MAMQAPARSASIASEHDVAERDEPLLGRPEAQLGLLRARGVAVEIVLDDVAGTAVQLVCVQRDVAVGAARPRLRDRELPLRGTAGGGPPERLPRRVPGSLDVDR